MRVSYSIRGKMLTRAELERFPLTADAIAAACAAVRRRAAGK